MTGRFNCALEVKFSDSAGTFSGYGAVFGNVDGGGDVIQKGAFRQTLREWGKKKKLPPMLLQHGGGMFGGGAQDMVPIGKWTAMAEDDTGLQVEGKLFGLDTDRGKSIYEAAKEQALDGLSIGFVTKEFVLGTKPEEPRRLIKAVDLWEVSLVTFPMNDAARVGSVKSMINSVREFEKALRDAFGYSNQEAKAIAACGFKGASPRDENDGRLIAMLADLNRARTSITL